MLNLAALKFVAIKMFVWSRARLVECTTWDTRGQACLHQSQEIQPHGGHFSCLHTHSAVTSMLIGLNGCTAGCLLPGDEQQAVSSFSEADDTCFHQRWERNDSSVPDKGDRPRPPGPQRDIRALRSTHTSLRCNHESTDHQDSVMFLQPTRDHLDTSSPSDLTQDFKKCYLLSFHVQWWCVCVCVCVRRLSMSGHTHSDMTSLCDWWPL